MKTKNWTDFPQRQLDDITIWLKEEPEQVALRLHAHDFVELVIVSSGCGIHQTRFANKQIKQGDVLVIPKGGTHGYASVSKLKLYNILFDPLQLPIPRLDLNMLAGYHVLFMLKENFFSTTHPYPMFELSLPELEEAESFIRLMKKECDSQNPGHSFMLLGAFMLLLGHLSRCCSKSPGITSGTPFRLSRIINFLNQNYTEPIEIKDMLRKVPMSQSALQRNFIRATGVTPLQYLQRLRIDHASRLLAENDKSITEIAIETGFNDSNYFTRTFRKLTGITPSEYRRMNNKL